MSFSHRARLEIGLVATSTIAFLMGYLIASLLGVSTPFLGALISVLASGVGFALVILVCRHASLIEIGLYPLLILLVAYVMRPEIPITEVVLVVVIGELLALGALAPFTSKRGTRV